METNKKMIMQALDNDIDELSGIFPDEKSLCLAYFWRFMIENDIIAYQKFMEIYNRLSSQDQRSIYLEYRSSRDIKLNTSKILNKKYDTSHNYNI